MVVRRAEGTDRCMEEEDLREREGVGTWTRSDRWSKVVDGLKCKQEDFELSYTQSYTHSHTDGVKACNLPVASQRARTLGYSRHACMHSNPNPNPASTHKLLGNNNPVLSDELSVNRCLPLGDVD